MIRAAKEELKKTKEAKLHTNIGKLESQYIRFYRSGDRYYSSSPPEASSQVWWSDDGPNEPPVLNLAAMERSLSVYNSVVNPSLIIPNGTVPF